MVGGLCCQDVRWVGNVNSTCTICVEDPCAFPLAQTHPRLEACYQQSAWSNHNTLLKPHSISSAAATCLPELPAGVGCVHALLLLPQPCGDVGLPLAPCDARFLKHIACRQGHDEGISIHIAPVSCAGAMCHTTYRRNVSHNKHIPGKVLKARPNHNEFQHAHTLQYWPLQKNCLQKAPYT